VFGDAMQYWDFFPASPDPASDRPWGRVPVWGFADVIESRADGVDEGRRVYGYFPMADELIVQPGRINEQGFTDVAEHRAPMAPVYSRYLFTDADPVHDPDHEPSHMVLWPLFATSFLIDDLVGDRHPGAAIVLSSASSKTAIGTAYCASRRDDSAAVGLTSPANVEFVTALGCYDRVVRYDDLGAATPSALTELTGTAAYVDIAGNPAVSRAAHERLADRLVASLIVGGTHWDADRTDATPPPGPVPEFFFAPAQIAKRTEEWGSEELGRRMNGVWREYRDWAEGWLDLRPVTGADATVDTYLTLLGGSIDPRLGYVCAL
jgi:hypothetical protein